MENLAELELTPKEQELLRQLARTSLKLVAGRMGTQDVSAFMSTWCGVTTRMRDYAAYLLTIGEQVAV